MNAVLELDAILLLVCGVLLAVGLWLLLGGIVRLLRGRVLRGPLRAAFGAVLGALAIALAAIAMNVHTYQRLNYEKPVAKIEFQQIGPKHYQALLRTPDGVDRVFGVYGDEWQLDARVLKWKGLGALLGLDPRYRLERFSGRYASTADEQRAVRSVYGLNEERTGLDVWALSQEHGAWLPLVDAVYGSAAYLPMRDGARYVVVITEDALVARDDGAQSSSRSQ